MEAQTSKSKIFSVLSLYQKKIEDKIEEYIFLHKEFSTKLSEACEYALTNGGKRFRPALVFMIAEALGNHVDVSNAAMAIEFFHTASLIADDLPCMDDDDERREKPSLHKVYGEDVALLASYALISAGYECLTINANEIAKTDLSFAKDSDRLCVLSVENVSYNTGLLGATGGQFFDMHPSDISIEVVYDVIKKKTVSLFEISFVLGWLFGGGDLKKLEAVKKAAFHFGVAFQISDDLADMEQDKQNERLINLANILGREKAFEVFQEEINQFTALLKELNLQNTNLQKIAEYLSVLT